MAVRGETFTVPCETRRCMAKCPVSGRKAFRARVGHGAVVKTLRHGARVRVLHCGHDAVWPSAPLVDAKLSGLAWDTVLYGDQIGAEDCVPMC